MSESCESCNAVMIQGVYCHETGCPDSWRGEKRECLWCGEHFFPEERHQTVCSDECYDTYYL